MVKACLTFLLLSNSHNYSQTGSFISASFPFLCPSSMFLSSSLFFFCCSPFLRLCPQNLLPCVLVNVFFSHLFLVCDFCSVLLFPCPPIPLCNYHLPCDFLVSWKRWGEKEWQGERKRRGLSLFLPRMRDQGEHTTLAWVWWLSTTVKGATPGQLEGGRRWEDAGETGGT